MSDSIIKVENLGKKYSIRHGERERYVALRDVLARKARGIGSSVLGLGRHLPSGIPKLKTKEMGSRYFFIVPHVWLEKYFSRGDYLRKGPSDSQDLA